MNTLKNDQSQLVKPLVCVRSITYNHAPYIADAMNGFCMQQTSFPFVCAVIDDCSTDGEQEVISNYLHEHFDLEDQSVARYEETDDYKLIYARHKENHNCFFVVLYLKYNHYSIGKGLRRYEYIEEFEKNAKYIALCEGDDYWTDPLKLQKQVDYLEEHPECGLVYTNSMIYDQPKDKLFKASLPKQSDFINLLLESPIMTLTTCFRRDLFSDFIKNIWPRSTWLMGDLPTWLYIASQSQIKYLPDVTSVYRILENSASHPLKMEKSTDFCLSSFYIRKFYAAKFGKQNMIKQICINHINELFKISFSFDKSVSHIASQLARDNSVYSPKTWIKIIIYSSSLGRRVHVIKNSNSI